LSEDYIEEFTRGKVYNESDSALFSSPVVEGCCSSNFFQNESSPIPGIYSIEGAQNIDTKTKHGKLIKERNPCYHQSTLSVGLLRSRRHGPGAGEETTLELNDWTGLEGELRRSASCCVRVATSSCSWVIFCCWLTDSSSDVST
jgi:hypothetical protein